MFVILDRDGVINYDLNYIKSPAEWIAIPESLDAIVQLKKQGCKVVVATNQSGIARHFFSIEALNSIHQKMQNELLKKGAQLDGIYYCPHHPDDNCDCRKPKIGLLKKIAQDFMINLKDAFFVGDSISDIQAAQAAHCKPVLVLTGKGQDTYKNYSNLLNDVLVVPDLMHFVIGGYK